jgi:hypothetical protein
MKKLFVNKDKEGRIIHSKAQINKPKIRPLWWFFEPVGENAPLKFLPKAHRAGFGANAAVKKMVPTDSDGVSAHNEFQLSVCGLDRFKVSVGLKRDGSDKITDETYQVWRRVYYSVQYMDAGFLFDFGKVHSEYHKYGIALKEIAPAGKKKLAHIPVLEDAMDALDLASAAVTQQKLEARIVLIDRLWLSDTWHLTKDAAPATYTVKLPKPNLVWPLGPVSSVVKGTASGVNIAPFATRAGNKVRFNFSGNEDLAAKAAKGELRLDYSIKILTNVLNGAALPDGRIVIAARSGIKRSPTSVTLTNEMRPESPRQGTMVHEIGHGLGMVQRSIREYDPETGNAVVKKSANPTYYQNGGGHCSTAAGGTSPEFVNGKCVMFHYGHDARWTYYCSACAPIVKRLNLARERPTQWP